MDDLTFITQTSFLHHGIQGQKWGVRNGPPYPLNKKESSKSQGKNDEKAINNAKEMFNNPYSENSKKMIKSAAKLGISAMYKAEIGDTYMIKNMFGDGNPFSPDHLSWFWYEDQTIGMPIIAALIDNGISRNKLSSMMKDAKAKNPYDEKTQKLDDFSQELIFAMREGYVGDDFINACYEIKKWKIKRR